MTAASRGTRARIALGCLIAVAIAGLARVQPAAQTGIAQPPLSVGTDFYYYGGQRIYLTRSLTEAVVTFRAGSVDDPRRTIDGFGPIGNRRPGDSDGWTRVAGGDDCS